MNLMATLTIRGTHFRVDDGKISGGSAQQRRSLSALRPRRDELPYVPSYDDAIAEHIAKATGGEWEPGPIEGEGDPDDIVY